MTTTFATALLIVIPGLMIAAVLWFGNRVLQVLFDDFFDGLENDWEDLEEEDDDGTD